MFKKNISISKTHILGGKDVKSLMKSLLKQYDVTQEQLGLLFPPKTNVTMVKLSNRSVVYLNESGNPMFFDVSGHGDSLLPTVRCTPFAVVSARLNCCMFCIMARWTIFLMS
jgi:hypothetical protein